MKWKIVILFAMKSRSQAFTLIELLVVVSILALIITLLQSSLQSALEASRNVVCVNNLKHQAVAASLYNSDHLNWMVPTGVLASTGKANPWHNDARYGGVLKYYYLGSYENFICPSREKDYLNEKYNKPWFVRDTDHPFEGSVSFYGAAYMDKWGHKFRTISSYHRTSDGRHFALPLLLQQIERPHQRILFADSLGNSTINGIQDHNPFINPNAPSWGAAGSIDPRHQGYNTNYVTVDGHAESVFFQDVYENYNNEDKSLWFGNNPINYNENIFPHHVDKYLRRGVIIEVK